MTRFSCCCSPYVLVTCVCSHRRSQLRRAEASRVVNCFRDRCGGCHSADQDRVGPRLRGVFGRAAGAVHTFQYSDALKSSHVVWDATTLDKWLQDPDSIVPDNDMSFRLDNKAERTAIIEYLKRLNAH